VKTSRTKDVILNNNKKSQESTTKATLNFWSKGDINLYKKYYQS